MSDAEWLFALAQSAAALPDETVPMRYLDLLRHGTMRLGLYAPRGSDIQGPHRQDELYVIASGAGEFAKNGATRSFVAGDVIFVEAGAHHRFERFTDDFQAWVIFWGPDGGEH